MAAKRKETWDSVGYPSYWESEIENYPDPNILVEVLKETDIILWEAGFEISEKERQSELFDPYYVVPLHEAIWMAYQNNWQIYEGYAFPEF